MKYFGGTDVVQQFLGSLTQKFGSAIHVQVTKMNNIFVILKFRKKMVCLLRGLGSFFRILSRHIYLPKLIPYQCLFTGKVLALHCVKCVRIRSYSGPHFPAFRLNTERYSVSLRI